MRSRRGPRWLPLGLLPALAAVLIPSAARAAVTVVACDGQGDIAAVQAAVDAAADGDTIALAGTCDFRAAASHGGGRTSIVATAVLIRPGSPVADLTVTSADPDEPATILGSGTQAAFTVAPGNEGVTIRGLRFVNLARAVVAAGTTATTVGAAGASAPSPLGNVVLGGATADSAVLGFAADRPMTVAYGTDGATVTFTPSRLEGFVVAANTIVYAPPGVPLVGGPTDVVGVDVRQADGGSVEGVTIAGNAVGMFAPDLPSAGQNAVRVEALDATPAPAPQPADFAVRGVTVRDNVLGRLEQLDLSEAGVDTSRAHAAGRIGVLLERVGGFDVRANVVRSRLSATATAAPGGGIVVSDSAFGTVVSNTVAVVADPATSTSDLGAIGVVDGLAALFGDGRPDQRTTDVEVGANQVGRLGQGPAAAQRGIVLSGPDLVTAHDNDVATTGGAPLVIGATVGTAPQLARTVTRSVACANLLNGTRDDPGAVAFTDGSPPSTANSFPGGSTAGAAGANAECPPTLALSPSIVFAGEDLVASGRALASRAVEVTVTDELGATRSLGTTAAADGSWSATFDATTLSGLADGILRAVATARDPSGFALSSAPATARKDFVADNPGAGTAAIDDGDGYTNANETLFGVGVSWRGPQGVTTVGADLWFSDANGQVPAECGPFRVPPDGDATAGPSCLVKLPDGPYRFHVRWEKSDGELTPEAVATSVKDTVVAIPVIVAPAEGATVGTAVVTVSGTAEPGATVTVRLADPPRTVLGTGQADGGGQWSVNVLLDDGEHAVSAFAVDVAGNRSASSAPRHFTVDTSIPDTVPPDPPVIGAPADGSLVPASFAVAGSAEPGSNVTVFVGAFAVGTAPVDVNGNWVSFVHLPEGVFALEAVATDRAGNSSARSAPVSVDVDAGSPTVTITTPPDTVFLPGEQVVIQGTATDNREVFAVAVEYYDVRLQKVRDIAPAACTGCGTPSATWSSSPAPPLAPGVYFARVLVRDRAGNVAEAAVRFTTLSP